jgi:hypothetical protein
MPRSTTRVNGRPLTRAECGEAGILARLATEDWSEMTAAAFASPNHVSSMDRWREAARKQNPRLDDDQVERLAQMMRTDHYRRMGRLSAQARKIARDAEAELARVDGAA